MAALPYHGSWAWGRSRYKQPQTNVEDGEECGYVFTDCEGVPPTCRIRGPHKHHRMSVMARTTLVIRNTGRKR